MEDKVIMTNLLESSKGLCLLLNHGSCEANDTDLNNTFKKVLSNCLTSQHDIYKIMQDMGWYPVEAVKVQEINKVKKKFNTNNN